MNYVCAVMYCFVLKKNYLSCKKNMCPNIQDYPMCKINVIKKVYFAYSNNIIPINLNYIILVCKLNYDMACLKN